MDGNAPRRGGSAVRTVAIGTGVILLVGIVAVASTGSVPTGTGGSGRRPSEGFVDTVFSLFLVMMALGAVFVVVALTLFRRYVPTETAPERRGPVRSIVSLLIAFAIVALFVWALAGSRGEEGQIGLPGLGTGDGATSPGSEPYQPEFAVWPVVAVLVLLTVAGVAAWLSLRGGPAAGGVEATPAEALADVLGETLDDLRAERDPRRAVIAAYVRMERGLAASGLPRREAEAPGEYLARALEEIELSSRAAGRLTALFTWARFSVHDVRPEMKDEAIETLEQVQHELAAADAARYAPAAGAAA